MKPAIRMPDRRQFARSGEKSGSSGVNNSAAAGNADADADGRIMAAVANGDAHAFGRVVEAEVGRIQAVSRRVLGNDADAQDVAQEALLRLWQQARQWRPGEARIRTWLYRVAVNLSIDRLRRRREVDAEAALEQTQEADQLRRIEERDLARAMDEALQTLPERQRIALALFHYEGATMNEVAEAMETSADAVESLLARGRRSLKQRLRHHWQAMLPDEIE